MRNHIFPLVAVCVGCASQTPPDPQDTGPASTTSTPGVVSVEMLVSDNPQSVHHKHFTVTTVPDAEVALSCVLRSDPAEIHRVNSGMGPVHEVDVFGLLEASVYDCSVAAEVDGAVGGALLEVETVASEVEFYSWDVSTLDEVGTWGHYTVFNNWTAGGAELGQRLIAVDPEGRRRWAWSPDPELGPSLEVSVWDATTMLVGGGRSLPPTLLSLSNEVLWQAPEPSGGGSYHHDVQVLPTGNLLTLASEEASLGDTVFEGFGLDVWEPYGSTPLWTWSSQDAVDAGTLELGSEFGPDKWHANAAQYVEDAEGPAVYVSLAYVNRLIRVDWSSREVSWSLGAGGNFTLFDESGTEVGDLIANWFYGQHEPAFDPPYVYVYDNGRDRPNTDPPYSRLVQLEVDLSTGAAQIVWDWREEGWYEEIWGGVDLLPNGNVLLTQGHCIFCPDNQGRRSAILEIDPATEDIVWRMDFQEAGAAIYRSNRVDGCALFSNAKYCPSVLDSE